MSKKNNNNNISNNWFFNEIKNTYDFRHKKQNTNNYIRYMLNRTNTMFTYKNLPDNLNQDILELQLQTNGTAVIYQYEDKLYSFTAGLGGELDYYYRPTIAYIVNPYLKLSVNAVIDKECIVLHNDSTWTGLLPMYAKYGTLLSEIDITTIIHNYNSRMLSIISTNDENTRESAEVYLKKLIDGELGVIMEDGLIESLRINEFIKNNTGVHDLIELKQYILSQWYIDIGLSSAYNLKKQYLNYSETSIDNDILTPLVDDMLKNRKQDIKKLNEMYGTNIIVELNSAWKTNQNEIDLFEKSVKENYNSDNRKEGEQIEVTKNSQ